MPQAVKKSRQKIRRNISRAAARGEVYHPPDWFTEEEAAAASKSNAGPNGDNSDADNDNNDANDTSNNAERWYSEEELAAMPAKERRQKKRMMTALNLQPPKSAKPESSEATSSEEKVPTEEELAAMSSKERRKWKRKLEALEAEKTNIDVTEFREAKKQKAIEVEAAAEAAAEAEASKKPNPYIVFVGQLSYKTTAAELLAHITSKLPDLTETSPTIRLLTDEKGKSKGMGFVEFSENPEDMYKMLTLHHTELSGRRINVERSSGGRGSAKKARISGFREDQAKLMVETCTKIIEEHLENGDIKDEELDEGVIALLKRHSATVVEQAIKEYVEMRGDGLKNPSSYLTSIVTRISKEGVEASEKERKKMRKMEKEGKGGQRGGTKRTKPPVEKLADFSNLKKEGVDMGESEIKLTAPGGGDKNRGEGNIFKSVFSSRGRGRR
ncbi:hypothetical protein TrCOL_g12913 [Triparma columacea]|uniref:RRM domain-containing protein n=1 Tax=Triparma columacea TaxID=722753 RepID=A0A9W7GAY5_9STRA|nr:hypothetical protein TrCOL_g12913 [Triparma columacea]